MPLLAHAEKLIRPWVLVTVGIVFNIVSALITSQLIDINNGNIQALETRKAALDVSIDSTWQNRQDVERKKEFILLLLQIGHSADAGAEKKVGDEPFIRSHIRTYLQGLVADYQLDGAEWDGAQPLSAKMVVEITDQAKQRLLEDIDDTYFDRILLEKQQLPIKGNNSTLMAIALFLQLIGLILVLARDLKR
jgi:hypothetical protein